MKTPDEIKNGLYCCWEDGCSECPYDDCTMKANFEQLAKDALAYIQQLEAGIDHAEKVAIDLAESIVEDVNKLKSRLAQAERERDAVVADLVQAAKEGEACTGCKNNAGLDACEAADFDCNECKVPCMCRTCEGNSNYEWRGITT